MVGLPDKRNAYRVLVGKPEGKRPLRTVFLKRRALASIITGRERFYLN